MIVGLGILAVITFGIGADIVVTYGASPEQDYLLMNFLTNSRENGLWVGMMLREIKNWRTPHLNSRDAYKPAEDGSNHSLSRSEI